MLIAPASMSPTAMRLRPPRDPDVLSYPLHANHLRLQSTRSLVNGQKVQPAFAIAYSRRVQRAGQGYSPVANRSASSISVGVIWLIRGKSVIGLALCRTQVAAERIRVSDCISGVRTGGGVVLRRRREVIR